MCPTPPNLVNSAAVAEIDHREGPHWGALYKPLTPALDALIGRP